MEEREGDGEGDEGRTLIMSWPLTGASHCHAHLGFQDKSRATRQMFFCYIEGLRSIKGMYLRSKAEYGSVH